jgi:hypothetical protein
MTFSHLIQRHSQVPRWRHRRSLSPLLDLVVISSSVCNSVLSSRFEPPQRGQQLRHKSRGGHASSRATHAEASSGVLPVSFQEEALVASDAPLPPSQQNEIPHETERLGYTNGYGRLDGVVIPISEYSDAQGVGIQMAQV